MKFFEFVLCSAFILLNPACKKNKTKEPPVTVHCENLVNIVKPGDNARIDVANAFTPNGDGLNDAFRPFLINIQSTSLTVYDYKSKKVYETTQPDASWAPVFGVNPYAKFYYRIEATTNNGSTISKCGEVYMLSCFPSEMNRSSFTFQDQYTGNGFTGVTAESMQTCK